MKISIVVPAYNEEENITELYRRLTSVLEGICEDSGSGYDSYEILLVDDGSTDRTWQLIEECHSKDERLKGISFSRNFGHHAAIAAGLDEADGDVVIMMDADIQAQPEDIPKALQKFNDGYDIVWAVAEARKDSFLIRLGSKIFYRFFNYLSSTQIPENIVFTCFSRRVVDAINLFTERKRFQAAIWSYVGFKMIKVEVEKKERFAGTIKYGFRKRIGLFVNGMISYSKVPLRMVTALGFFMAFASFLVGLYMLYVKLVVGAGVSGFTSIIVSVTMLSGVQLVSLGIVSEYLGVIFDEVKERPLYITAKRCE